jgi:hypothetical protein
MNLGLNKYHNNILKLSINFIVYNEFVYQLLTYNKKELNMFIYIFKKKIKDILPSFIDQN